MNKLDTPPDWMLSTIFFGIMVGLIYLFTNLGLDIGITVIGSIIGSFLIIKFIFKEDETSQKFKEYPENWDNIRLLALQRDNYECGNCKSNKNLHVHHIVPLSRGGSNNLSNLRTLCEDCHKKLHPHMQ